jgi:hypothetical protein
VCAWFASPHPHPGFVGSADGTVAVGGAGADGGGGSAVACRTGEGGAGAGAVGGAVTGAIVVSDWLANGLGSLSQERVTILAATLLIVGIQVFFTSFLLSIIGLRRPQDELRR